MTLKVFIDVHSIEVSRRIASARKKGSKLRHHDVISMVCKLVSTLMENSSRVIIVREILVMVKIFYSITKTSVSQIQETLK